MRTGIEFKKQAKLKEITFWESHKCSICGVAVGTEINNGEASYRSACECAQSPNHPHGWEHVAERYNIQTHKNIIKNMDDFWGFTNNNN